MFDGSKLDYEDNRRRTSEIVALCHSVARFRRGRAGRRRRRRERRPRVPGRHPRLFTDPALAGTLVRETDVDALAVAIGNAHGKYKGTPRLDLERLAAIHDAAHPLRPARRLRSRTTSCAAPSAWGSPRSSRTEIRSPQAALAAVTSFLAGRTGNCDHRLPRDDERRTRGCPHGGDTADGRLRQRPATPQRRSRGKVVTSRRCANMFLSVRRRASREPTRSLADLPCCRRRVYGIRERAAREGQWHLHRGAGAVTQFEWNSGFLVGVRRDRRAAPRLIEMVAHFYDALAERQPARQALAELLKGLVDSTATTSRPKNG